MRVARWRARRPRRDDAGGASALDAVRREPRARRQVCGVVVLLEFSVVDTILHGFIRLAARRVQNEREQQVSDRGELESLVGSGQVRTEGDLYHVALKSAKSVRSYRPLREPARDATAPGRS